MKKVLFIILGIALVSISANAQTIKKNQTPKGEPQKVVFQNNGRMAPDDYNYAYLLQKQNQLLKNRRTALVISLSGSAVAGLGESIWQNSENGGGAGPAIAAIGAIGAATGGIWLLVNEFKLITNQSALNDIRLKAIPGGMAIQF